MASPRLLFPALALLLSSCAKEAPPRPWFHDAAAGTNLRFSHASGAAGQFYMPEIMGSGAALLDYDADGDLDILLVQGTPQAGGSRLFRNELSPSGKLAFTDATAASGIDHRAYGMGTATGDFDNDGRVDLLLTSFGGNRLYRNVGGVFRDVTGESQDVALPGRWSSSAAFFDYDRDGLLDLAILNYLDYSYQNNKRCQASTGEPDYCTPKAYPALPAHLFHNERGRFVEVTRQAGLTAAAGPGLGIVPIDANGDGWLDLFVANDSSANHLWINKGNGRFEERALEFGVAFGEDGLAKAGMGVAAGDYDNDGDADLLVLNLMREGATLFRNNGSDFSDVSRSTGIHALTFPFTGFGTGWFDFDRDGWLDLFLANGAVTRREEQRGQAYPFLEQNLLLRNPGSGGSRFADVTAPAGPSLSRPGVHRAAAFGDVDNDGDVDIVVNVNNGPARLLRNDAPPRNWIAVEFEGPRLGEGNRVAVRTEGRAQTRWTSTAGSYLSSSDSRAYFGLGSASGVSAIELYRPAGSPETIRNPQLNRVLKARSSP